MPKLNRTENKAKKKRKRKGKRRNPPSPLGRKAQLANSQPPNRPNSPHRTLSLFLGSAPLQGTVATGPPSPAPRGDKIASALPPPRSRLPLAPMLALAPCQSSPSHQIHLTSPLSSRSIPTSVARARRCCSPSTRPPTLPHLVDVLNSPAVVPYASCHLVLELEAPAATAATSSPSSAPSSPSSESAPPRAHRAFPGPSLQRP